MAQHQVPGFARDLMLSHIIFPNVPCRECLAGHQGYAAGVQALLSQAHLRMEELKQALDQTPLDVVDPVGWPIYVMYYALPCRQQSRSRGWYLSTPEQQPHQR